MDGGKRYELYAPEGEVVFSDGFAEFAEVVEELWEEHRHFVYN